MTEVLKKIRIFLQEKLQDMKEELEKSKVVVTLHNKSYSNSKCQINSDVKYF
jgi:hypothetical protein